MFEILKVYFLKPAFKLLLALSLVVAYSQYRLRQYLKRAYDSIPVPCMEDYMDDLPAIHRFLGAESLNPEHKIKVYCKMGKPAFFKSRILGLIFFWTTDKAYVNIPSQKPKAPLFQTYRKFLGYHSILFQEGQKARKERGLLNQGFTQQTYRLMHGEMIESGERLKNRMIEATSRDGSFQADILISRATLEVIGKAGFGMDLTGDENTDNVRALKLLLQIPGKVICLFPYGPEFLAWYHAKELDRVRQLIDTTVLRRLEEDKLSPGEKEKESRDLLDVVISAARACDLGSIGVDEVEWIRDQIKLFYVGGSDTSSLVLSWAAIILADRQDLQQKVKAEIKKVVDSHPDNPQVAFDDLSKLTYMEAFLKETLRMHGPVGGPVRRLEEGETSVYGMEVPEPKALVVGYYTMMAQRRDDYYPEGDSFIPERWLDGRADGEALAVFSSGFRTCLGKNFSYVEMKTFLATILYGHSFVPLVQGQKLPLYGNNNGLAAPEGAYPIRLVPDK